MTEPAFPVMDNDGYQLSARFFGVTKRELYAAMAMQGLLAKRDYTGGVAKSAVEHADALIAELERTAK